MPGMMQDSEKYIKRKLFAYINSLFFNIPLKNENQNVSERLLCKASI